MNKKHTVNHLNHLNHGKQEKRETKHQPKIIKEQNQLIRDMKQA